MQTNAPNCETVKKSARKNRVNNGSGLLADCPPRISRGLSERTMDFRP